MAQPHGVDQPYQQGPPGGPQYPPYQPPSTPPRRKWPWIVGGVVALLVVVGIANGRSGGGGDAPAPAAAPSSAAVAPASTAAAAPISPAPTAAAPPVAAAPSSWVMPDLVGENLQDAQNAIQVLTDYQIFLTTSSDASGEGRQQVLDSNWRVCGQNIAPGETITVDSRIDFSAVKLDEDC